MKFDINIVKKWNYENKNQYNNHLNRVDKFLKIKQSIGENWFFEIFELNNLETEEWNEVVLGFSASNFQISNDSSNIIIFSWDGINIAGILNAGEAMQFNQLEREKIYLKSNGKLRIWSY
jgi:hypothetical protein